MACNGMQWHAMACNGMRCNVTQCHPARARQADRRTKSRKLRQAMVDHKYGDALRDVMRRHYDHMSAVQLATRCILQVRQQGASAGCCHDDEDDDDDDDDDVAAAHVT